MWYGVQDWNEQDDKFLHVKIYNKAIHNKFKSEQEKRQVYDDQLYISIITPGQKNSVIDRKLTDKDKVRFKLHVENFEKNQGELIQGTPIDMLPAITPSQVATLRAMKVQTVQQLAGLHEDAIKKLYEGRDLVQRATKFIQGEGYAQELEKTIKTLEERIKHLEGTKNEPVINSPKRNKRNTAG